MKALVGAFNQEKALVGAFSVTAKTGCGTDGWFYSTTRDAAAGTWTRAGTGCSPTCWPTPAPPRPVTPGTGGRPALQIWRFWWLMLPLDVTGLNASASGIVVLVPIEI